MENQKLTLALIKAIIGTLLFILIYHFANIKIVKENLQIDKPFDWLHRVVLLNSDADTNSPQVMIFGVDNDYLKKQDMMDENNETTYGYLFPRGKIAEFIERVDGLSQSPKALFIDYDFSFTTDINGSKQNLEDKKLIAVLKKERSYTILIPKTSHYNLLESLADKQIQKLIKEQKIRFVSVKMPYSKDLKTRRFIPYASYKHATTNQEQNYTSASMEMWKMFNPERNITKEFNQ